MALYHSRGRYSDSNIVLLYGGYGVQVNYFRNVHVVHSYNTRIRTNSGRPKAYIEVVDLGPSIGTYRM